MNLLLVVATVVIGVAVLLVVARRRTPANSQPPPDFLVLEADSPAISESGSLTQNVGIRIIEGGFAPLLQIGSAQPVETSFTFSTTEDNQDQITLQFYRGNSDMIAENTFLGEARITGYPLGPAREPLVRVFVRAADGQFSLAAIDDHTGRPVRLIRTKDAASRALQ